MVFTQPVKLFFVGEEGKRRLEIPVCVENVRNVKLICSIGDLLGS